MKPSLAGTGIVAFAVVAAHHIPAEVLPPVLAIIGAWCVIGGWYNRRRKQADEQPRSQAAGQSSFLYIEESGARRFDVQGYLRSPEGQEMLCQINALKRKLG